MPTYQMIGIHVNNRTSQLVRKTVLDMDTRCVEPYTYFMEHFFEDMDVDDRQNLMSHIFDHCTDFGGTLTCTIGVDLYIISEI